MAAADVSRPPDDVTGPKTLRNVLADHRAELIRSLDASTLFLTYLARHELIEPADIVKYKVGILCVLCPCITSASKKCVSLVPHSHCMLCCWSCLTHLYMPKQEVPLRKGEVDAL